MGGKEGGVGTEQREMEERAVVGVGKVRGRRKVGGKKRGKQKKPPSKFDTARIIADETP